MEVYTILRSLYFDYLNLTLVVLLAQNQSVSTTAKIFLCWPFAKELMVSVLKLAFCSTTAKV